MNHEYTSLLAELYDIDPSLKEHERELIPLIEAMLRTKPEAKPDTTFVASLRRQLRGRAATLAQTPAPSPLFSFLSMPKLSLTFAGAAFGILLAVPVTYLALSGTGYAPVDNDGNGAPIFSYSVSPVGARAFGDLSSSVGASGGLGGGMGGDGVEHDAMVRSQGGGAGMVIDIYPPSPYYITEYSYTGDPLALPEDETVSVLRRLKNMSVPSVLSSLRSLNLGLVDLGSFAGAQVESLSLYQDRNEGYYVHVNFKEGTIGISQNWEKWSRPDSACETEECFRRHRLGINDLPSDEEAIRIASAFLREHGIPLENVGEPVVDQSWRRHFDTAQDTSELYVPEDITVIYPFLIDGEAVYEEGGMKSGITVSVSARHRKASSVWNLVNRAYESSAYAAVSDPQEILSHLASYGNQQVDWLPPGTETRQVTVELGTPTRGYARMYRYENNRSDELFVPALIFPVTRTPTEENFYSPQSVIVPLARDLLQPPFADQPVPLPRPLILE